MNQQDRDARNADADDSSSSTQTPSLDELAGELDAIRAERSAEVAHLYA